MHLNLLTQLLDQRWILIHNNLAYLLQPILHLLVFSTCKSVSVLDVQLDPFLILDIKWVRKQTQCLIVEHLVIKEVGGVVFFNVQAKLLPKALTGHSRRSERMLGEERRFKQNHSMRMRHAVSAATLWESRRTYRTVSMAAVAKYTLIVSCAASNTTSRRGSQWRVPSAGLSGAMTHLTCLRRTRRSTERQNRKLRKKRRKLSSRPN
jgi:hypothetical protein